MRGARGAATHRERLAQRRLELLGAHALRLGQAAYVERYVIGHRLDGVSFVDDNKIADRRRRGRRRRMLGGRRLGRRRAAVGLGGSGVRARARARRRLLRRAGAGRGRVLAFVDEDDAVAAVKGARQRVPARRRCRCGAAMLRRGRGVRAARGRVLREVDPFGARLLQLTEEALCC